MANRSPTFEYLAERLIGEAIEAGWLEQVEGAGRPLAGLDDDPEWWAKRYLERIRLEESVGRRTFPAEGR